MTFIRLIAICIAVIISGCQFDTSGAPLEEGAGADGGSADTGPGADASPTPDVADASTAGQLDSFVSEDPCDGECHNDEVCVDGECRRARNARHCDMCPCEYCEDQDSDCCMIDGDPMCVEGSGCPL